MVDVDDGDPTLTCEEHRSGNLSEFLWWLCQVKQ